jgi:transposase-like protein
MTGERKGSEGVGGEAGAGAERSAAQAPASLERRGRPGRRRVEDRVEAVLELLAGKASVDQIAWRLGVRPSTVESWREVALDGVATALRQGSGKTARELTLEREVKDLRGAFTSVAMQKELLERALTERPSRPRRFGR